MRFVAFDFETANDDRSSACAIGLVLVEDGRIIDSRSWLISPPDMYFDPFFVGIHGITEEDVADAPDLSQLWDNLVPFFEHGPLLAHNASFDMSVLRHTLDFYEMSYPEKEYFCTMVFARKVWPDLPDHRLATVAENLSISFQHHDPAQDAFAAAQIALRAGQDLGADNLLSLAAALKVKAGKLFPGGWKPCGIKRKTSTSLPRYKDMRPTANQADPSHPLYGKTVVFTGEISKMPRRDAAQIVVNYGGVCKSAVSGKTDFLILGHLDPRKLKGESKSSKIKKAESLIASGKHVEVITEEEFLDLIK